MNFFIIQCIETDSNGIRKPWLSVMPSQWVEVNGWNSGIRDVDSETLGDDVMFWPHKSAHKLLIDAEKNPDILPCPEKCDRYRCKIKRKGFATKKEASRELKVMESKSDTDSEPSFIRKIIKPRKDHERMFSLIKSNNENQSVQIDTRKQSLCVPALATTPSPFSTIIKEAPGLPVEGEHYSSAISPPLFPSQENISVMQVLYDNNNIQADAISEDQVQLILEDQVRHQQVIARLDAVENKIMANKQEILAIAAAQQNFQKSVIDILSQINAKLDVIGSFSLSAVSHDKDIQIIELPFQPISNAQELQQLNNVAKDVNYFKRAVLSIGQICGKNIMTGNGWSVGLKIIDKFFKREFLTHCTWTGAARGSLLKHCLSEYKTVLDLIEKVILYSDNNWTTDQNGKFLRSILNNSSTRYNRDKSIRTPSARSRGAQTKNINKSPSEIADDDFNNTTIT